MTTVTAGPDSGPYEPFPPSRALVVRLPGRWVLTPPRDRVGTELDLEGLLVLVAAAGFVPDAPSPGDDGPTVSSGDWLAPVPAFMGEIRRGGLWLDDGSPHGLLLDPVDLTLVDAIGRSTLVEAVVTVAARHPTAAPSSHDELHRRLGRLAAAARIRFADGPDTPSTHPRGGIGGGDAREGGRPVVVDYLAAPLSTTPRRGVVPVYAVWPRGQGPLLALGMLTAAARHHRDGALNDTFDIRRPEDPASFLADLAGRPGPGILLCSNYVWSVDQNLAVAEEAVALNPELVVIHGGPSTPKYPAECEAFFADHPASVHITVRAEGEAVLCGLLEAFADAGLPWDLEALADVAGLSFRSRTGAIVHTGTPERIAELDALPSPYLTGEFDHLTPAVWNRALNLETNRGCPYGCTFCDWGSVTLSRIRKFDLDRVTAEMTWAAERGTPVWVISDANFGILARDVEITRRMAELKSTFGVPEALGFTIAKNTTKHLVAILELLTEAGIQPHFALSLQSRDPDTLAAIHRSNISTEHYQSLAAAIRSRELPSYTDLMLGLPGQTVDSFRADLQFLLDHELTARVWLTQLLPNAPMNDPTYRDDHRIEVSDGMLVQSTASFSRADRDRMLYLRYAYLVFEQFGLLRHVLRFVQWDHGILATDVMAAMLDSSARSPESYPLISWALRYFDLFVLPPLGRRAFLDEVRRFLLIELDLPQSAALESVLQVQAALLPDHGRTFPEVVTLEHDYVAYYEGTTRTLATSGEASRPERPLGAFGPGVLEVMGDPLGRCTALGPYDGDPRDEGMMGEIWLSGHYELDSVLARLLPEVAASGRYTGLAVRRAGPAGADPSAGGSVGRSDGSVPVVVTRR